MTEEAEVVEVRESEALSLDGKKLLMVHPAVWEQTVELSRKRAARVEELEAALADAHEPLKELAERLARDEDVMLCAKLVVKYQPYSSNVDSAFRLLACDWLKKAGS